jgi:hypothetical protein
VAKALLRAIIGVALTAVVLLVPIIPVDVTVTEVEYYERLARYVVIDYKVYDRFDFIRGRYTVVEVVVMNVDKYGGPFTVTMNLYTDGKRYGTQTISKYIAPGEILTFKAEFDTAFGQKVVGDYEVEAPTVIDKRLVTKHKTVYKSIIELILTK